MACGLKDRKGGVKSPRDGQVEFNGKWVDQATFRSIVWNDKAQSKVAQSWDEYCELVGSGEWHPKPVPTKPKEAKEVTRQKLRRARHGDSQRICKAVVPSSVSEQPKCTDSEREPV